jgi:hypothetical protein
MIEIIVARGKMKGREILILQERLIVITQPVSLTIWLKNKSKYFPAQ